MICNLSKLTAFNVSDPRRLWGKVHDILIEMPGCRTRYFSVDAHVGVGEKEICAPVESIERVDAELMEILVKEEMDKTMTRHLNRLETPRLDRDELRLHRLYHTAPEWVPIKKRKGGPLRKQTRLMRASQMIGMEALSRSGSQGWVRDLLFDSQDLSLQHIRLQFMQDGHPVILEGNLDEPWQLRPNTLGFDAPWTETQVHLSPGI